MTKNNALQPARLVFVCLFLVITLLLAFNTAKAAPVLSLDKYKQQLATNPEIPWNLEADSIYYDSKTETYAAEGHAILSQPGKKVVADTLKVSKADMRVIAQGNVEIYIEDNYLQSESIEIDLANETGRIKMGYIFIRENNFHIKGSDIAKLGEDEYEITDGVLTSCDGPDPDWRFESKRTNITVDGYGYSYDTVFYVKNVPLFYTPFFAFPAKTTRQTGLLAPMVGVSKRLGLHATLPFYWAIDEQQDATFYAQYLTERGLRLGGEYRYNFGSFNGALQADYIHDIRTDKGVGAQSNRYGYDDGDNDFARTNKDRFWIRGAHRQSFAEDWRLMVNIDYASDQDYLRDFRGGYMGYAAASKFFMDNYYWDIEGREEFVRTNKLLVNRNWSASSFNAQVVWNDDIIARKNDLKNFTVQQLPSLSYTVRKQKIGDLPLFYTLDSEYGHYWREDGPSAQRVDIHPRMYAPINFSYFTLEPSLGIRETYWYQYGEDLANTDNKHSHNRLMLDTRTRLSSQFNRVYDVAHLDFNNMTKIRHAITPEIIYDYVPGKNQKDLPYFTNIDRIGKRNQVFASLTTSFTSKIKVVPEQVPYRTDSQRAPYSDETVTTAAAPAETFKYLELLRFNFKQGYDFNADQGDKNEHLMPFYASVKIEPMEGLRLAADAAWSFSDDTFVSANLAATAYNRRGDSVMVAWRSNKNYDDPYNMGDVYPDNMLSRYYIGRNSALDSLEDKDRISTLFAAANIRLIKGVELFGDTEYNFADHTRVETNVGVRYTEQCWAVEMGLRDEKDGGLSINLFFTLFNIGNIGI